CRRRRSARPLARFRRGAAAGQHLEGRRGRRDRRAHLSAVRRSARRGVRARPPRSWGGGRVRPDDPARGRRARHRRLQRAARPARARLARPAGRERAGGQGQPPRAVQNHRPPGKSTRRRGAAGPLPRRARAGRNRRLHLDGLKLRSLLLGASMSAQSPSAIPHRDPHSFGRPDEIAVDHLTLDLTVDFDAKKLAGSATLRLARHADSSSLWLDARDLDIHRVTLQPGGAEAKVALGDEQPHLGRPLTIEVAPDTTAVHIQYSTRPEAAALQWLDPAQAGSTRPFLFTQSQAILARTWVPCQDSPGVRMTYDATIRVPSDLLALMSAENPQALSETGTYTFRMPQAIPSYLLALSVGDLAFRPFDANSGVYALPSVIEKAHWELEDTPRMIAAAEKLYGP